MLTTRIHRPLNTSHLPSPAFIIVLVVCLSALLEVLPLNFVWCAILWLPDTARSLFNGNFEAMKLCTQQAFDFIVPVVSFLGGLVGFAASFDYHAGCCVFSFCFFFLIVANVWLGECYQKTKNYEYNMKMNAKT